MATKNKKLKLSPPWDEYMQMLKAFFAGDDRFTVSVETEKDDKAKTATGRITAKTADLAAALYQVLNTSEEFGNVTLNLVIDSPDGKFQKAKRAKKGLTKKYTDLAALKTVLQKNPRFDRIKMGRMGDRTIAFCIFKPVVVQWYADNLGSPWKINSGLMEAICDRILRMRVGALLCTAPVKG